MIQKTAEFDLDWKKQISLFLLLAITLFKQGKSKHSLHCLAIAHKIPSNLPKMNEHYPRNIDYLLAVNGLTSFLLMKMGKIYEALKYIYIAEELTILQVEYTLEEKPTPQQVRYYTEVNEIQQIIAQADNPHQFEIKGLKSKEGIPAENSAEMVKLR